MRERSSHEAIQADTRVRVDNAAVDVDVVNDVESRHIYDKPAAILRGVAVAAPETARDDTPLARLPHRAGHRIQVWCGDNLRHRGSRSAPPTQATLLDH
ncbi:hypothetical protein GCM10011591_02300 [Nocardia camponoti]|uniref:Uncharacterized protein n=1 Tax=Nocardia camponoti TaxID=1616106 RepID=A0A917Q7W3_9NOCA|nr:hypothetical protein GCM10011591_02300 [Nocardia camponoti]